MHVTKPLPPSNIHRVLSTAKTSKVLKVAQSRTWDPRPRTCHTVLEAPRGQGHVLRSCEVVGSLPLYHHLTQRPQKKHKNDTDIAFLSLSYGKIWKWQLHHPLGHLRYRFSTDMRGLTRRGMQRNRVVLMTVVVAGTPLHCLLSSSKFLQRYAGWQIDEVIRVWTTCPML